MIDPTLSFDLRAALEKELEPQESLLWAGQPKPAWFTPATTAAFLFGIPWTAFSVFWICGAAGFKMPDFSNPVSYFPLFGVPFVLIGIAMLSSPVWGYLRSRSTVYAITSRRLFSIEGTASRTIKSYTPSELNAISRTERPDGTADVLFGCRKWPDSDGDDRSENLGFFRISNARHVEQLIRGLASTPDRPS